MLNIESARRPITSSALRYGLAVSSVAIAFILTFLMRPDGLVTPVFFLAIILSAWVGGIGPGMLAALLATLGIAYFFLPPVYSLRFDPVHLPQLIVFFVSAALVSSWSAARKRAETLLRQALDEQEAKVQERTADLKQANEKLQVEIAERGRVEETLRERADLLDLTHDTVFVRGMDDVITYWNRGAEEMYGWTSEEAVGRTTHDLLRTIFPAPLEEINAKLIGTGRWEGELVHTRRDGAQVVVASRWALQRDESSRTVAILETNNAITERKRAEEALQESEEQWKAVFESNPTMYFMVDAAGTTISVNTFGAEQLGYTPDELVRSPVLDIFYEPDREAIRRNVARCFDRLDQPMSWEARKVRKDGKVLWVRETARAVLLKDRPVILVACEDITERKRAEEQLEKTEQRLRAVIANTPVILFALDRSGVYTLSEGRGLDALGLKPGEVVGQSVSDVYGDATQVLSNIRRALAGESFTEVVEVHDSVFETHYIPVLDEGGQVGGVNGVAINITERKRAEEELLQRASLLDLTHDTVFVRDMNDVITYWNRGAEEMYGWKKEEAVGQVSHLLTQTIFPVPLKEINEELLRTGRWEGELIHAKRDGLRVMVASRWSLQRDEHGNPIAILETNNDVTERRRAEKELRESERRYRSIFQGAGVSIWEEDFSPLKDAMDDLKARGVRDFRQYLAAHPEFVRQAISMVKIVDVNDATVRLLAADSKEELLLSLARVFVPETEEVFAGELVALSEGRTSFESETVLRTLNGDRLTVLFTITFPPEPSKLESVLVSIMDITERKRAEEGLAKAQAELAHLTRMMTMGEMAASIAHEVNQPLTAVITNANAGLRWLAGQSPNLGEAREAITRIVRDGNRASEVIKRIRAMLKKTTPQKSHLDLNEAVRETMALAQGEARRNKVLLTSDLTAGLPPVLADRVQLQQVVLNLIINGIEAMKPVTDRPRNLLIRTQRDESGRVMVAVRDSGTGIDPQSIGHLFDAFYTTKAEGMGMGLSISRSIIEAHGGKLWASANNGDGATFQFTLPANGANHHN